MIEEFEETFPPDRWIDQPERTPRAVERLVNRVGVDSSLEEVMTALDAAEWLAARSKLILTIAKKATVLWIEQNGEFAIGPLRYSVGVTTTTKCVDVPRCAVALIHAVSGDVEAFSKVLIANPYKYGTARSLLDRTTYGSLFHVSSASRLVNGVPERTLIRSDPTFVRSKSAPREK